MKFEKPINIRLTPHYAIKELYTEEEHQIYFESVQNLGGIAKETHVEDITSENKILRSGGRMDWAIYQNPDYNLTTPVQLMRIWACQLVTQMVNNKSYVNEVNDEPKFDISDEEKEVYTKIMEKMYANLNHHLEKVSESMVMNKKIKKIEL